MNTTADILLPPTVDTLLESSLKDIGIPPCPAILTRVSGEMRKESPDFKQVANIINTDVALGASLIKTANSPFFGFRSRVRSVNEALMILGLAVASKAIAGIVLRRAFPITPALERFWDSSARIARLSGWLAQDVARKTVRPDDVYTYALFRDCGIPVLFNRFPAYEKVIQEANNETIKSFTEIEETQFPTNHAMVGCILAQSWGLPEETCLAIRHHHDLQVIETPAILPPRSSRYHIAIAQLAEFFLQRHTGLCHTCEWPKLGTACLQLLEIGEDDIEPIFTEAKPVIQAED
jgi:HD-like signal output (HDOD) protein